MDRPGQLRLEDTVGFDNIEDQTLKELPRWNLKKHILDGLFIGSVALNAFTTQLLLQDGDQEVNILAREAYKALGGNEVWPFAFCALGIGLVYGAIEGLKYFDKNGKIPNIKKGVDYLGLNFKEGVLASAIGGFLSMSTVHIATLFNSGNNMFINSLYGLWSRLGEYGS